VRRGPAGRESADAWRFDPEQRDSANDERMFVADLTGEVAERLHRPVGVGGGGDLAEPAGHADEVTDERPAAVGQRQVGDPAECGFAVAVAVGGDHAVAAGVEVAEFDDGSPHSRAVLRGDRGGQVGCGEGLLAAEGDAPRSGVHEFDAFNAGQRGNGGHGDGGRHGHLPSGLVDDVDPHR
jgi:hypothetical protein